MAWRDLPESLRRCDLCGAGPWEREGHMKAHRGTRRCKWRRRTKLVAARKCGIQKGHLKWSNVRRTLRRRIGSFLAYLCNNARLQRRTQPRATTYFVPFGLLPGHPLHTADVKGLADVCQRSLRRRCRRGVPDASAVATVAVACILLTDRWAALVQHVPVPMTARYMEGLERRVRCATAARLQLANTGITGLSVKSLLCARGAALTDKIAKLMSSVRSVAEVAPSVVDALHRGEGWVRAKSKLQRCFDAEGYAAKFIPAILTCMGFSVQPTQDAASRTVCFIYLFAIPDRSCSLFSVPPTCWLLFAECYVLSFARFVGSLVSASRPRFVGLFCRGV